MPAAKTTENIEERPFPVSADEARAIQDGLQTYIRRVIIPQPPLKTSQVLESRTQPNTWIAYRGETGSQAVECPYGKVGDRLWVRETWTLGRAKRDDGDRRGDEQVYKPRKDLVQPVLYRANRLYNDADHRWRQSTRMPRWASRLTLEIISITAQQLRGMMISDCEAEGVRSVGDHTCLLDEYEVRWNAYNSRRGYPWHPDLWTWVVQIKKVQGDQGK